MLSFLLLIALQLLLSPVTPGSTFNNIMTTVYFIMFENIINDFKMSMKTKKGLFTTTTRKSRELIKCEIETECDKMTEI